MTSDPRLPAPLASARRRLELWRSTHSAPARIPPDVWNAAVRCATKYGLCPTARALGLDYNSLKRRMTASESASPAPEDRPAFLELPVPPGNGPAGVILEVERPGGAKLRVELWGSWVPDLADLARRFAGEGA